MSPIEHATKPLSRTQEALNWLEENPDQTAYAASKRFGIAQSTLSQAKKLRQRLVAPLSRAKQADAVPPVRAVAPPSRTQKVLAWLDAHPEETAYTAAHRFNIAQSTISRAKKARVARAANTCAGCGQVMSELVSRSQQALLWLKAHPQSTRKDAAVEFGITPSALYALGKNVLAAQRCPQCGRVLKQPATR